MREGRVRRGTHTVGAGKRSAAQTMAHTVRKAMRGDSGGASPLLASPPLLIGPLLWPLLRPLLRPLRRKPTASASVLDLAQSSAMR